jgi:hypothetical protein
MQLWRTRRLFPDISLEGEGLGAALLIAAALLAQVGFALGLIAFAKRVRAARVARVAVFTLVTAAVGAPFCVLAFDLSAQLEALSPRIGHILFLFSPLWATSLVTIVCALILLPKTARIVTLDSAATVIRTA